MMTKDVIIVCALLAAVYIKECNALVEPLDYLPQELQGYLDTCHSTGDLTKQSGRKVFWTSINQFMCKFTSNRPALSPSQTSYLSEAVEEAFGPLYTHQIGRVKRQAWLNRGPRTGPSPGAHIRREIRAMPEGEIRTYFTALNRMKRNRSLPPNVYDYLAEHHTGENIRRAHFGPAFPGWHRLYLWLFEYFLRLHGGDSVPYWASVMEGDMTDASQTALFSPQLFGNGDGAIRNGPFQNWPQINSATAYTRSVQNSQLYSYAVIGRIIAQRFNRDILVPTAQPNTNFELEHGLAHTMVGGSMSSLQNAAYDPVFFSHHTFVDYIWERFRENQIANGINPQDDYPFDATDPRFRPEHSPDANAGFTFGSSRNWTQSLGYLNAFADLVYYEDIPRCPGCAGSRYLYCDRSLGRCVPRSRAEIAGGVLLADVTATQGRRKKRQVTPNSTPSHSMFLAQDSSFDFCPKRTFINDVDTKHLYIPQPSPSMPSNKWAYIAVKVVSKRPKNYHSFSSYSLYEQGIKAQLGLNEEDFLKPGLQKEYESCDKFTDTVGKITIVSYGLNYHGSAEEYVIIDNRHGVSEGKGFIPVKMPTSSNPSEAIIAAFDSCGRVCKPYCKKGSTGGMVSDSDFSGGIRVSTSSPLQYSDSYANSLLHMWEVPSASSCPSVDYNHIPISFYCEYTDTWIWDQAGSGGGSTMAGQNQVFTQTEHRQESHITTGSERYIGRSRGSHTGQRGGTPNVPSMNTGSIRPPKQHGRVTGGRGRFGGGGRQRRPDHRLLHFVGRQPLPPFRASPMYHTQVPWSPVNQEQIREHIALIHGRHKYPYPCFCCFMKFCY